MILQLNLFKRVIPIRMSPGNVSLLGMTRKFCGNIYPSGSFTSPLRPWLMIRDLSPMPDTEYRMVCRSGCRFRNGSTASLTAQLWAPVSIKHSTRVPFSHSLHRGRRRWDESIRVRPRHSRRGNISFLIRGAKLATGCSIGGAVLPPV